MFGRVQFILVILGDTIKCLLTSFKNRVYLKQFKRCNIENTLQNLGFQLIINLLFRDS